MTAPLDALRELLPEYARDLKINLQNLLAEESLPPAQRWGVAVAAAAASRYGPLREAMVSSAREAVGPEVVEDALAAATLMGMNNVYYRFRHVIGRPEYSQKPARLRMTRIAKPASTKANLELFSLAVSAINNCVACMQSHEKSVLELGVTEDQVHDAVRIASVVHAAAIALESAPAANSTQSATQVVEQAL